MAYTTAEIDATVKQLEGDLKRGVSRIVFEGRDTTYWSAEEILKKIDYFKTLYVSASDAPVNTTPKVRTSLFFGGKGF